MAENVVLGSFSTLQNSSIIATLNANNSLIEAAFADCLSLAGTQPNQMQTNLDMNENNVINLPAPSTLNSPIRLVDLMNATLGTFSTGTFGILGDNQTWTGNNTFTGTTTFTGATNLVVSGIATPLKLFGNPTSEIQFLVGVGAAGARWRYNASGSLFEMGITTNGFSTAIIPWTYSSLGVVTHTLAAGDGYVLQNTTAAAAGVQQASPNIHLIGQGWKTNSVAASLTVDWTVSVTPVQGTSNPTSMLSFSSQINAGGFISNIVFSSQGDLGVGSAWTTTSQFNTGAGFTNIAASGSTGGAFSLYTTTTLKAQFYNTTSSAAISTTAGIPFVFQPAATEAMRLSAAGGVNIGTSGTDAGAKNLRVEGTITDAITGVTNPVVIGQNSTVTTSGIITLNNVLSQTGAVGLTVGSTTDLYCLVPTGGTFRINVNNVSTFASNATLFSFTSGTDNPIKCGQNTTNTKYNIISLNNATTNAANIGLTGGGTTVPDSSLYIQVPTGGTINAQVNAATVCAINASGITTTGSISTSSGGLTAVQSGTSYSMAATDSVIQVNSSGGFTLTLVSAASVGRHLWIKQQAAFAVSSASSNVIAQGASTGGATGTSILSGAGKWAHLVSDGTNWVIVNSN